MDLVIFMYSFTILLQGAENIKIPGSHDELDGQCSCSLVIKLKKKLKRGNLEFIRKFIQSKKIIST